MKKIIIFIICTFFYSEFGIAQDTIHFKHPDTVRLKKSPADIIVTDRPPQTVFIEFGGRSIIFSGNYDARFSKRVDGIGYSVGLGYTEEDALGLFSVPVSINWLLGKKGKYFETGIGATYFNKDIKKYFDNEYFIDNSNDLGGSSVIGTFTAGYRRQPIKGGFVFRTGFNILIYQDNFAPIIYLGFGYSF